MTPMRAQIIIGAALESGFKGVMGAARDELRSLHGQAQEQLFALTSQRTANLQRRAEIQGKLFGATAMAAASVAPVASAIKFESAMADVRKVVDFDTPQQFKTMGNDILAMSRVLPMSAQGISEIIAAAGRAGVARDELLGFGEDAVRMSVAFDMSAAEAGAAMTGFRTNFQLTQTEVIALGDAINTLDNNMDATAAGITNVLNRAGPMARQFGLSAEATAALASSFIAMKTRPEVAATAINAMMTKMAAADRQGQAFQEGLAAIGWTASDLKAAIADDAQGALVSFLKDVSGAEDKIGILTDLFGLEYADNIAALTGNLGVLEEALGLSTDTTRTAGAMQKEYEARAATTANQLTLLKNSVTALAVNLGDVLLPSVNAIAKGLSVATGGLSAMTQKFPLLTTVVTMGVTGLVTLRLATLATAWSWTFLKGAWISARASLIVLNSWVAVTSARMTAMNVVTATSALRVRALAVQTKALAAGTALRSFAAGLIAIGTRAIPLVIGGVRALTAAMLLNPIGLAITAIAGGAFLIMKYWTPISGFFKGIWDSLKSPAEAALNVFKTVFSFTPLGMVMKAWTPLTGFFKKHFGTLKAMAGAALMPIIGPLKLAKGLLDRIRGKQSGTVTATSSVNDNDFVSAPANDAAAVAAPSLIAAPRLGASTTITHGDTSNVFHIHAAPGQSPQELAETINDLMDKRDREKKTARSGAFYDEVLA